MFWKSGEKMRLEGKYLVITGGAGVIGLVITRFLWSYGADVERILILIWFIKWIICLSKPIVKWLKLALLHVDYCDEMMTALREMFLNQMIFFYLNNVSDKNDVVRARIQGGYEQFPNHRLCRPLSRCPDWRRLSVEVNLTYILFVSAVIDFTRETMRVLFSH